MNFSRTDLFLFLFLFCALSLTFAGHGASVDENLIIQVLDSFFKHGELTVTKMFQALPGPDGKYYSRYGFGFTLILAPFYLLGSLLEAIAGKSNIFYRDPHFFMLLWAQILITTCTGWVFFRVALEMGSSKKVAAGLALTLIFGTTFWPYSQSLYRLTLSALILLLVLWLGLVYARKQSPWFLFAIVLLEAYGLNVREDLSLAFLGTGLFLVSILHNRDKFKILIAFFIGGLLGFILWMGHNYIRFGSLWIENYADLSFTEPWIISMPQMLFGKKLGLILYSPIILFFPFSLKICYQKKQINRWILGAYIFLTYFCLYASSTMYHGGQCFGPRHMFFIIPFILLPLISLFENASKTMNWLWGLAVFVGMTFNWPGLYSHHGKYESFFSAPSFFTLMVKYPHHPYVLLWDELDFWWIRTIELHPFSIWPILFFILVAMTIYFGFQLFYSINTHTPSDE